MSFSAPHPSPDGAGGHNALGTKARGCGRQGTAGREDIATTLRYYVSIRAADMVDARNVAAGALQVGEKWTQNEVKAVR